MDETTRDREDDCNDGDDNEQDAHFFRPSFFARFSKIDAIAPNQPEVRGCIGSVRTAMPSELSELTQTVGLRRRFQPPASGRQGLGRGRSASALSRIAAELGGSVRPNEMNVYRLARRPQGTEIPDQLAGNIIAAVADFGTTSH